MPEYGVARSSKGSHMAEQASCFVSTRFAYGSLSYFCESLYVCASNRSIHCRGRHGLRRISGLPNKMKKRKRVFISIIFVLTLFTAHAIAQDSLKAVNNLNLQQDTPERLSNAILYPIRFFADTISRADGDRCPMYPSCSAYSQEAFRNYGFLKGWIMTSDRLLRCGRDELKHSAHIWIEGKSHVYDPVINNDFWR